MSICSPEFGGSRCGARSPSLDPPLVEVQLDLLPEVVERHCVDVFPGEALRDDDREGEAFVFHAPEKGPPERTMSP